MKTTRTTTTTTTSSSTPLPTTASTSTSTTVSPSRPPYVSISNKSTTTTTTTTYNVTNMTNVTIVAGVLEVELYQQGNISQEALQGMFKGALAAAVEIPFEFVVKLNVSEVKETSGTKRRLQENQSSQTNQTNLHDNQTKVYEVAYEIMVPEYMDADAIIEKANRIAEPGSNESQLFRQVLLETDGVLGVGSIVSKVSAYKVGHEVTSVAPNTPSQEEDDHEIWKVLGISLGLLFLVVAGG